jgi:hypothetical protein
MWSGWGLVLRILIAEAARSSDRIHALLETDEAAIRGAAVSVLRAPRIILCLGTLAYCNSSDENF